MLPPCILELILNMSENKILLSLRKIKGKLVKAFYTNDPVFSIVL